jgi:hypothetical protein
VSVASSALAFRANNRQFLPEGRRRGELLIQAIHVPGVLGVSLSGCPSLSRSLFGLMMAGEPEPGEPSTFASTWRRNSSTSLVECFEGSMCAGSWCVMAVPVRALKGASYFANVPIASVSQTALRRSDGAYKEFRASGLSKKETHARLAHAVTEAQTGSL